MVTACAVHASARAVSVEYLVLNLGRLELLYTNESKFVDQIWLAGCPLPDELDQPDSPVQRLHSSLFPTRSRRPTPAASASSLPAAGSQEQEELRERALDVWAELGRRATVPEVEEFFRPYAPYRGLAGTFALGEYHKLVAKSPPLRIAA